MAKKNRYNQKKPLKSKKAQPSPGSKAASVIETQTTSSGMSTSRQGNAPKSVAVPVASAKSRTMEEKGRDYSYVKRDVRQVLLIFGFCFIVLFVVVAILR